MTMNFNTIKNTSSPSLFAKVVMIFVILSTILSSYGWSHYNFTHIISIILCVIFIFRQIINHDYKLYMPSWLGYYFIYLLINHILWSQHPYELFPKLILVSFFMAMMLFKEIDFIYFIKAYKTISVFVISLFFIQEIMYATLHYRIVGITTLLPLNDVAMAGQGANWIKTLAYFDRSASFFREPAHFAQWLLPLFLLILFNDNESKKSKFKWCSVIIISLVLSRSGNGLIGLFIILIAYCLKLFSYKSKNNIIYLSAIIAIVLIAMPILISSESGEKILQRTEEISSDDDNFNTSGFQRIFRGYFAYDLYSPLEKITGIDNSDILNDKIFSSPYSIFFIENQSYYNGIQEILLRTGVIGIFIMSILVIKLWKNALFAGRVSLFVWIIYSFISSNYLSIDSIVLLNIAYKFKPNPLINDSRLSQIKI